MNRMKKICLVQGGKFLLGIDAERILARTAWAGAGPQRGVSAKAVHLGALLSRQPGGTPPPDAVCLELRDFFLIVDQIAADGAELINPPGPLPPACPRLAARLCPQVTIWGDTPVLLLDPAQVLPVAEELGEGIGMVVMPEEFCGCKGGSRTAPAADDAPEEPLAVLAVEESVAEPESEDHESAGKDPSACPSVHEEITPPPEPPASAFQEHKKEDSSSIDEETFQKVLAWTVAKFKQRKAGEELRFSVEQLPSELAAMVWQKGLSKNIIQYLIDQIVLRCQESAGRRKATGGKHAG
jgi:hypothetical protein